LSFNEAVSAAEVNNVERGEQMAINGEEVVIWKEV
jgi:hypothetical protein